MSRAKLPRTGSGLWYMPAGSSAGYITDTACTAGIRPPHDDGSVPAAAR